MSRIGKEPVKLADGVTATIAGQKVTVKGSLGKRDSHKAVPVAVTPHRL